MAMYDHKWWQEQITHAQKSMEKFCTSGERIVKIYLDEHPSDRSIGLDDAKRYNLFWANVGILKSALYGNPPKATASREFMDPEDDVGRVAAEIMQRLLSVTPDATGQDLHEAFVQVVEDRLLPGMGQLWLRYESEVKTVNVEGQSVQQITDENVACDYVFWRDFLYSPVRVWKEVHWVARRVWMTKAQLQKRFPKYADQIEMKIPKDGRAYTDNNPSNASLHRGEIFEIWCKTTKKVYWIGSGCDKILDNKDDPLDLPSFWPCPRPLLANTTTTKLVPRADYTMVQDQYTQLDELNIRIGLLTQACKAVGVYDKTAEGVQRMLQQGVENQLIPVDNWAAFAEKDGIKGVTDWVPVEAIVNVIEKLRELRADIVQQIYELTGISDIMRGVTNARETLGAQKLKSQYSSSRLMLYQMQIGAFVSEALNIKAMIISKHFQPETIFKKSLIEFTADAELAPSAIQLIKDTWHLLYRINVSSTQMSIPDYNAEKEARVGYIMQMGKFLSELTPMLQMAPEAAPFVLKILQWGAASFQSAGGGVESLFDNFIRSIEKKLATPPPPPPPDPVQMAKAADLQASAQLKGAQTQAVVVELQGAGGEAQASIAKIQAEIAGLQARLQAELKAMQATTAADVQATAMKTQASVDSTMAKTAASVRSTEAKTAASVRATEAKEAAKPETLQ